MPMTRVVVAGGGFAAAEAVLALGELAGDRMEVLLVAPDPWLRYRPGAPGEPFDVARADRWPIADVAAAAGARYRRDSVEAVAGAAQRVRLGSGTSLAYDALILAPRARRRVGVPGALTFRDERDTPLVRGVVEQIRAGEVDTVAFAVPAGTAWPLPLYEVALLTAADAAEHGRSPELLLVTPEEAPLEVFGDAVSDRVAALLADRRIRFVGGEMPRAVGRGALELGFGSVVADRVIAVPQLLGTRIGGVPSSWSGFIATDAFGRVEGLDRVWAAGDATTYPIKQGGIATQQAEAIVQQIVAADSAMLPTPRPVLRTRLLGADGPLYLRTTLDRHGRAIDVAVEEDPPWWPPVKVVGRRLAPWLATHAPLAA